MVEREVVVKLKTGLQARPAAFFVQTANQFSSDVFIEHAGRKINAKSIMGIMSLAIANGKTIKIIAEGSDEEKAVSELASVVEQEEI